MKSLKTPCDLQPLMAQDSCLGPSWIPVYEQDAPFEPHHFEIAMSHLIREPNINSTVILRADIIEETAYSESGEALETKRNSSELPQFPDSAPKSAPDSSSDSGSTPQNHTLLHRDLDDLRLRKVPLDGSKVALVPAKTFIRRIIPRNPYKDHIINQTCAVFRGQGSVLVVYIPHLQNQDEVPFYLPPVHTVGILYHENKLSIHYVPFENDHELRNLDASERPVRIALRLLQTSCKHSVGVKSGYEKRVNHDLVVPRVAFQNRYIALKKKYSGELVSNWVESTDPKKHVFEDLAVAAFLIELWGARFKDRDFEFRDLGCGNGLLVHILIMEGFKGQGIDARARKSWKTYPEKVQNCLLEQIIIPSVLLKPHPAMARMAPYLTDNGRLFQVPEIHGSNPSTVPLMKYYSAANLLESSIVCTTEQFPVNTFIIGNHSDELTCWIPLLNFPFMVIPCCSHALNGAKRRYNPRKVEMEQTKTEKTNSKENAKSASKKGGPDKPNVSMYGALVDHVEDLALSMGWKAEREVLRIPSTRNAAVIGMSKEMPFDTESKETTEIRVLDILAAEGGAEGWVENSLDLMRKSPKNH